MDTERQSAGAALQVQQDLLSAGSEGHQHDSDNNQSEIVKTEQDLQDSGFQVLNQDLSDYGGAFLKAEQDLNHTAPERLEQHLYNPGSVINNVEQVRTTLDQLNFSKTYSTLGQQV